MAEARRWVNPTPPQAPGLSNDFIQYPLFRGRFLKLFEITHWSRAHIAAQVREPTIVEATIR